jgi:hypothetical protein
LAPSRGLSLSPSMPAAAKRLRQLLTMPVMTYLARDRTGGHVVGDQQHDAGPPDVALLST